MLGFSSVSARQPRDLIGHDAPACVDYDVAAFELPSRKLSQLVALGPLAAMGHRSSRRARPRVLQRALHQQARTRGVTPDSIVATGACLEHSAL